jgi:signal transduction histidine kinase
MIFFKIVKNDKTFFSNFGQEFDENHFNHLKVRIFVKKIPKGEIVLFGTDYDYKLLANKHIAEKTAEVCEVFFREIINIKQQEYSILSHNFITNQSLMQDAIERVVPEKSLARAENHIEQIEIVKNIIDTDKQGTAESFLTIVKSANDMQAQLEGLKILNRDFKLDLGSHNIKTALENIIHPFYKEFRRREIKLHWGIDHAESQIRLIKIDYKILYVAIHHFFNNVIKYIQPYSHLNINFDHDNKKLEFQMISAKIDEDELERIFIFGYRGKNVKEKDAGEGIGMYMVSQALNLINAKMIVSPDYSTEHVDASGDKYVLNKFTIQFA